LSLYNELKRRNVLRVGAAYIVTAWLVIQVVETIFPAFGFSDSAVRFVVIVFTIGLVPALILSWAFEITPEGLKKETDVDRTSSITRSTGKQLDRIIMVVLALALGYFAFDKFVLDPARDADELATATQEAHQDGRSEALVESYGDKSIAVLPFVNMSSDPEQEYFSDGISEELLNVLSKVPELRVISRSSSFSYKDKDLDIPTIAAQLSVAYILEGSVRKAGNQVRITTQLIEARSDTHLWSQTYDRKLVNIFAIQDEIAESIAAALKVSLRLESRPAGNLTGTNSIEAYEHYLKGISFWHERTLISLESANKEFEAAATLDPQFAKAWAGQALFWTVIHMYTNKTVADAWDRARTAARRALSLDPESVESMAVLGLITENPSVAFEYFDRAIELNPSSANTYHWYSVRLAYLGDPEASLAMARKAWTLDPRAPNNSAVLAMGLSGLGYNREAEQITQELLSYAPEHLFGLRVMLVLKILSGECASARQYGDKLAELLNKKVNSTQVYMDLCQQDNPAVRAAAVKTVSTWPLFAVNNPAEPNLSGGSSTITLLTELGELDAAWQLLEKYNTLASIRTRITENGISLQCDPRVQKLAERLGKSDPIKPVSCD